MKLAFQDLSSITCCYGCGANNLLGLQIKSYWKDDSAVCTWTPAPHHTAGNQSIVYGGIISCLIDCHSVSLATATAYQEERREIGSFPTIQYVCAKLMVDFLKPTPIGTPLTVQAKVQHSEGRKTWVLSTVTANNTVTVKGEVLAVRLKI